MNSDVGNVLLSEHKNVEKMNVPHKAFTRKIYNPELKVLTSQKNYLKLTSLLTTSYKVKIITM